MKIKCYFILFCLLLVGTISRGQIKDTLVNVNEKQVHLDYDQSWSKQEFSIALREARANQQLESFKASPAINQILNQIPVSTDPCRNGGFESNYNDWTGLSLRHGATTLPIENGLLLNPGILPLPYTGTGSGQNYTSIESAGLDPLISVAVPPFPLQKLAPGTTGSKSLRLGNNRPGYGAEGVAKRFIVTAANAKYYFQYSIVMDRSHSNPDGSVNGTEVFFIAEATTMSGTTIDKVVDVGNPSNPFVNAVNNGSTYYRDWRCAYLDLSGHIGQEIVVMFINSDCSAGGHKGYTYVDDICKECVSNEGEIHLNLSPDNCMNFPQTISGNFSLPITGSVSNVNIELEIYQSNVLVNTITSPSISAPNYSFTLSASDFPDQTPGACYDLVAKLTFDFTNSSGTTGPVTKLSSNEVNGVQDGENSGINNDVCFCADKGDYCCEGDNLVNNGNFESGDTGFSSAYTNSATTFPGEYDVVSSAAAFNATVTDHSFCADPVLYPTNNLFMVVNGKTQQTGSSVVWEQTITGLEVGEEYKFCANFKDMEQCTFNIFPNITVNAGPFSTSQVIDTDDSDPCDWERIEICFTANNATMNLQIELDETGNGDGNDLAIDDIALQQKLDPNYFITVQHQGNNNDITGSLNTIVNTDDTLLNGECESNNRDDYYWFVYEPLNPTAPLFSGITPGTFGWSSNLNWSGPGVTGPWGLTTNFPSYPFASNKFYVIGIYIPSCCESCYTESFEYQITYNNGFAPANAEDFSYEMKEDIKASFVKSEEDTLGNAEAIDQEGFSLYPNPAQESFNISLLDDTIKSIEVISISGKVVYSVELNQDKSEEVVEISTLSSGMYFVNVTGTNQKRYTAKLIKE